MPEPALVPGLVREMLGRVNDFSRSASQRAGYAMWRCNWIHPFAGGNGRTARALAYLAMCVDFGRLVPGNPSFPTRISNARDEYVETLRKDDQGAQFGHEDGINTAVFVGHIVNACLDDAIAELQRRIEALKSGGGESA